MISALGPDETNSDQEGAGHQYPEISFHHLIPPTGNSDDDIAMPVGPPPSGLNESEVDSDDEIPMPAGPPPGRDGLETCMYPLPFLVIVY